MNEIKFVFFSFRWVFLTFFTFPKLMQKLVFYKLSARVVTLKKLTRVGEAYW